ncbi:RimJ/RimL family protein N-acetyltransferase [Inquilinus ginsengisoli]|uniref:GNAT family N-acetyltransferase n=1 Tax=Inquilinus ginsengisoli TaxID=363840 RepID=UPI003D25B5E1
MPDSTIETERLVLRPHRAEDFADLAAMWADPEVTRFIGGRPSTPEESWARLLRYGGLWGLLGFGYWAVHERATSRFVGEVGFADFRRGLGFDGVPEAGWILMPWAQGRGLAGEAVRAALAWADARVWDRSVCIIDPENAPSLRLAEACGYREADRITYKDHPVILLERLRQS